MDIKDIIKNKRIEKGLTMKELAEKVGVSEATISRWESGEISNMKHKGIILLANALDISPNVIMGWEDLPEPPQEEKEDMFFRIDLSKYTKQQQEEMKKELEKFYGYLKSNLED